MGSQVLSSNSEAAIWARLMRAQKDELSSEAAEFLLSIDFGKVTGVWREESWSRKSSQIRPVSFRTGIEFGVNLQKGRGVARKRELLSLALMHAPPRSFLIFSL